jgi:hypothetical protein
VRVEGVGYVEVVGDEGFEPVSSELGGVCAGGTVAGDSYVGASI